jgi:hypothetical protein
MSNYAKGISDGKGEKLTSDTRHLHDKPGAVEQYRDMPKDKGAPTVGKLSNGYVDNGKSIADDPRSIVRS